MQLSKNVFDAAKVIAAEKSQIDARRERIGGAPRGTVGLAFSGGGIRSATLNLGILQGLAARGLLPYFDYLSTVSGGGYIGSWLHGVILRCAKGDPREAEKFLRPPDRSKPGESDEDPIAFLRKFSSYLAPDLGLLSADAWVIAVIWLRNMALNLTILFPFAAAIALLLIETASVQGAVSQLPVKAIGLICMALALGLVVAVGNGVRHVVKSQACHDQPKSRPPRDRISIGVLCTALLWLISFLLACAAFLVARAASVWPPAFVALLFLFLALELLGGFLDCHVERKGSKAGGWALMILFAAISAAVTAAMICGAMAWMQSWTGAEGESSWLALAFGPPLMMLVFLTGAGLLIGLMGVDFPDFGREWLSRIGAFLAITAFAWAAMFAVIVFAPFWIVVWARRFAALIASGWLLTTIGGVLAGKSGSTGGIPKGLGAKLLDVLARIAPPVFMMGFFVLASTAVHQGTMALAGGGCAADFVKGYWCVLEARLIPLVMLVAAIIVMLFMQWRVNINEFSMAHFYKNRLVRCYLGASRRKDRRGSPLTGFDPCDDFEIASLDSQHGYLGPYAIINAAINLNTGSELARRERKAGSFIFTPGYCGYNPPREAEEVEFSEPEGRDPKGYRATRGYYEPAGPKIGTCVAISGAAANPNMGFHTSAPVAFLMTVFDVRLGWWLGNTRFAKPSAMPGPRFAMWPLLEELFAQTDARSQFVSLSDGGHFENLGIYELVRRRCRYIIAGDGEEDSDYTFESLGGVVRKCRADFGVEIRIDPRRIHPGSDGSGTHCVVGRIDYPEGDTGWLLYLKSSLTGDEPEDVMQYKASHPDFPQESTGDQFFTESQFESYRKLGLHIVDSAFDNTSIPDDKQDPMWLENVFECLYEQWYPPSAVADGVSSRHTAAYSNLMRRLSEDPDLKFLDSQIFSAETQTDSAPHDAAAERKAFYFCLDLIQLMEDVWSDLHFSEKADRENPKNQGWITVFRRWSRQPLFQETWQRARYTYNPLFQQFFDSMADPQAPVTNSRTPCGPLPK